MFWNQLCTIHLTTISIHFETSESCSPSSCFKTLFRHIFIHIIYTLIRVVVDPFSIELHGGGHTNVGGHRTNSQGVSDVGLVCEVVTDEIRHPDPSPVLHLHPAILLLHRLGVDGLRLQSPVELGHDEHHVDIREPGDTVLVNSLKLCANVSCQAISAQRTFFTKVYYLWTGEKKQLAVRKRSLVKNILKENKSSYFRVKLKRIKFGL